MRELRQLHTVSSNGHCTHMSVELREHFLAVILTAIFLFKFSETVLANGIALEFKFTI